MLHERDYLEREQGKASPAYKEVVVMPDLMCGVYKHYKGGLYLVLGIAQDGDTEELSVVYISLTGARFPGPRMRLAKLSKFFSHVSFISDGHNYTGPRFVYIGQETV